MEGGTIEGCREEIQVRGSVGRNARGWSTVEGRKGGGEGGGRELARGSLVI